MIIIGHVGTLPTPLCRGDIRPERKVGRGRYDARQPQQHLDRYALFLLILSSTMNTRLLSRKRCHGSVQ